MRIFPRALPGGGKRGLGLKVLTTLLLIAGASVLQSAAGLPAAETHRVWEKVEVTFEAGRDYGNPLRDVTVWVDLEGPGFEKRCFGFWDGGRTFRVRVLATTPGSWSWRSGSDPDDPGLAGRSGSFLATEWSEREKAANPCRRGMILASPDGHAFQHADGTPFFLLGDTWWSVSTFRYPWYDDDTPRPLGPGVGFKDLLRLRERQGYNAIALIAAFPAWANDGRPPKLKTTDGTVLRSAWRQPGTQSAKDMHDESGQRPFLFPGKVPGYENIVPDLDRPNPAYFRSLDRKVDFMNSRGFVPFIEVTRRDIGQAWKRYHEWPDSYVRYIQYVWSRYQAHICLFSPIHFDWKGDSIPAGEWNEAANEVIDRYGPPPFGTLAGTNSNPSTLRNFGHVDKARWLSFHQIGNRRTHDLYPHLTEIFNAAPPVPGLNGEPYYDGMLDAAPGSGRAALYCRSAMYGSVLSGGLAGHIYGAGGWDGGMWGGNVEEAAEHPIWEAILWPSANQMQHLRDFVLSEGALYQKLVPASDLLSPARSGKEESCTGWAYCARTGDRALFLLYFEQGCPRAVLSGARARATYTARWFDPRTGSWSPAGRGTLIPQDDGTILLPAFPGNVSTARDDWAMQLKVAP